MKTSADFDASSFHEENSDSFRNVASYKFIVIMTILKMNVNVLYTDSDIIIFKNPLPYLLSLNTDFAFQQDDVACTGFFFSRPTMKVMKALKWSVKFINEGKGPDQIALNCYFMDHPVERFLLDRSLFCSGDVFFSRHQYYWDPISPDIYMMHNNYIRGRLNKQYRFLEMGFMEVIRNEDTLPEARYITVESFPYNENQISMQLRILVAIANALNRTVVVPPIPCNIGKGYCLICGFSQYRCFDYILKAAVLGYRESVGKKEITDL